MELKDFIKGSIIEICHGIYEAREEIKKEWNNNPISPVRVNNNPVNIESQIDFDIAITISNEKTASGSGHADTRGIIKIVAADVGINGAVGNSIGNERCHRIKFSVPFFPGACCKMDDNARCHASDHEKDA